MADPIIWGPAMWNVLFEAAFRLPKDACVRLFQEMSNLLPCLHCRKSYGLYVERFPPSKCINSEDLSAARYIWSVKDSVNQKLGTACLPFSVTCSRFMTFTQRSSAHDVLDCLGILALYIETQEQADSYAICAPILCSLASALDGKLKYPAVDEYHTSPATAWIHAHECRNVFRVFRGVPPQTRAEMRKQLMPISGEEEKKENKTTKKRQRDGRVSRSSRARK